MQAYDDRQSKTYIHVYYRGPACIENGMVVIPCEKGDFNLEESIFDESLKGRAIVWAVFDCHRDDIRDGLPELKH